MAYCGKSTCISVSAISLTLKKPNKLIGSRSEFGEIVLWFVVGTLGEEVDAAFLPQEGILTIGLEVRSGLTKHLVILALWRQRGRPLGFSSLSSES